MTDTTATDPSVLARYDRIDVADLILRERLARDDHQWDDMLSCWDEDSSVEVSWFRGTGPEFVKMSSGIVKEISFNFHVMSFPVVNVMGDRAISDTPCQLRDFTQANGTDVSYEGFVRLLWRAKRTRNGWRLAGLRSIYLVDLFHNSDPAKPLPFDMAKLQTYRRPYRFLTFSMANVGVPMRDDLPGRDQPEVVARMRETEVAWLRG